MGDMGHIFYGLSCFSLKHSKHQWKKNFSRLFQFYSSRAQFSGPLLGTVF